jgi:hypothetical protein
VKKYIFTQETAGKFGGTSRRQTSGKNYGKGKSASESATFIWQPKVWKKTEGMKRKIVSTRRSARRTPIFLQSVLPLHDGHFILVIKRDTEVAEELLDAEQLRACIMIYALEQTLLTYPYCPFQ